MALVGRRLRLQLLRPLLVVVGEGAVNGFLPEIRVIRVFALLIKVVIYPPLLLFGEFG